MRFNWFLIFIFLYSSLTLADTALNASGLDQSDGDFLLIYTPLRADITRQRSQSFIDYVEAELGFETVIPQGDCEEFVRYQQSREAVVLPYFSLWKPLMEKGYIPILQSSTQFEIVIFSKRKIESLTELRGAKVALTPRYRSFFETAFEQRAKGVWSSLELMESFQMHTTILQVLEGKADYGIIGGVLWGLMSQEARSKLKSIVVSTDQPSGIIMVPPTISEQRRQHFQQVLESMHNDPAVNEWLQKTTFIRFIPVNQQGIDAINAAIGVEPKDKCWKE